MRKSKQRELVQAVMAGGSGHMTAAEVYEMARQQDDKISLGTVYRNLNELVAAGKLCKFSVPDEADRFDVTLTEHQHVYCRGCGRVFDLDFALMGPLRGLIKEETGVEVDSLQLVGTGLCQDCRNNKLKKKEELCQN
jgi:Fur family peroxide stress response transcriptional regulator